MHWSYSFSATAELVDFVCRSMASFKSTKIHYTILLKTHLFSAYQHV